MAIEDHNTHLPQPPTVYHKERFFKIQTLSLNLEYSFTNPLINTTVSVSKVSKRILAIFVLYSVILETLKIKFYVLF